MRRTIMVLICSLALAGCATLKNPFAGGHFSNEVWKADLVVIKSKISKGTQAIRDTLDQLCPEVAPIRAAANDPANRALAAVYFGSTTAVDKQINNINDGLRLLDDACQLRSTDPRGAIVVGAQAINDVKRIIASTKK